MEASEITLEELKNFFDQYVAPLPKSVQIYPDLVITGVPLFIEYALLLLEGGKLAPYSYRCFKTDLAKLKNQLVNEVAEPQLRES